MSAVELSESEAAWLEAARAAQREHEASAVTTDVVGAITQAWYYAIDIALQPAVVVLGGDNEALISDVAQVYATQVQRPVLVVAGPAPADAQVLPVSGVTGVHVEREAFALELDRTLRSIDARKHA